MDDLRILESSPWAVVHDDVYFEVFDRLVGIWNRSLNLILIHRQIIFEITACYYRGNYIIIISLISSRFNLEDDSNPKTLRIWTFLQLTQALLVPQTRHECSAWLKHSAGVLVARVHFKCAKFVLVLRNAEFWKYQVLSFLSFSRFFSSFILDGWK